MPLEDFEDLLLRKKARVGAGRSMVAATNKLRTAPERKFIGLQRDKGRLRARGRRM